MVGRQVAQSATSGYADGPGPQRFVARAVRRVRGGWPDTMERSATWAAGGDHPPSGGVRPRGGAHRRADPRGWWPVRAEYAIAAAALAAALAVVAGWTIARTPPPGGVADRAAGRLALPPGGLAGDQSSDPASPSPGPSTSPEPSASPSSRSASPSAARSASSVTPAPATPSAAPSPSGAPSRAWTTLTVTATKALFRGDSARTNRTKLIMQSDGNLAIIDENGVTRWISGTADRGSQATFQADGNFVVYDTNSDPLWSSRTPGHNGAVLVLQANGDVCIIDHGEPVWCAGTAH